MNNEVLERLLIDHAVGELPPDVEELLEAHLLQNPEARKEAVQIGETIRLARLALAGQPAVPLSVLQPSWHVPNWAWRMAACFVCGLSIGIFAMHGRNESLRIAASNPSQEIAAITAADESGIWSARRFRASLSSVTVKAENRIIWKSPVRKPEMF
jgi:anti-sigma factor RsiW